MLREHHHAGALRLTHSHGAFMAAALVVGVSALIATPAVSSGEPGDRLARELAAAVAAGNMAIDETGWPDPDALAGTSMRLFEGDILVSVPNPGLEASLSSGGQSARGIGLRGPVGPWPDGIIPYVISDDLPDISIQQVREAIDQWNQAAGISLLPRESVAEELRGDFLLFQDGPGCASWVGRQGGEQPLWVGPICSAGSIMHEIGHAIGLEHEHTRPDRDQHIVIHRDRIDPDKLHNFELTDFRSRILGDYDYESIMHYGPSFFSIDGTPTMEPLIPIDEPIGQRDGPSTGDVQSVALLYGTDLSMVAGIASQDGQPGRQDATTDVTVHVTNEQEQGAHGLSLTLATDGLEVVGQSDDAWQCELARGLIECQLDRLVGGAQAALTLTLRGRVDAAGLQASLLSETPDTDASNNSTRAVLEIEDSPPDLSQPPPERAEAPQPAVLADSMQTETAEAGAFSPILWLLLLIGLMPRLARPGSSTTTANRRCQARTPPGSLFGTSGSSVN